MSTTIQDFLLSREHLVSKRMLETTWEVLVKSLAIAVDRCEVIFELISVS